MSWYPVRTGLQLVAVLDTGRKVVTQPVVFRWEGKGQRVDNLLRFTAADPGWKGPGLKTRGFERNAPDGHVSPLQLQHQRHAGAAGGSCRDL